MAHSIYRYSSSLNKCKGVCKVMKGFISGMTTGAIIGAAVGVMMLPEMDRSTRKKIKRFDRMVMNMAGQMYSPMRKNKFF